MDGERTFDVNGDRFRPGCPSGTSEVGLSSLSISAFILRLVCTNGMVSKTELSASYRHVSTKILTEFPQILEKVSVELGSSAARSGYRWKVRLMIPWPPSIVSIVSSSSGKRSGRRLPGPGHTKQGIRCLRSSSHIRGHHSMRGCRRNPVGSCSGSAGMCWGC